MKHIGNRFRTAFTIVELVIVIAIIAVLMGIGFIGGNNVVGRSKEVTLENDLNNFASAITQAMMDNPRWGTIEDFGTGETLEDPINIILESVNSYLDGCTFARMGILGDVTDDGVFDAMDLLRYRKWLRGDSVSINKGNADMNGDGILDSNDADVMEKLLSGVKAPCLGHGVITSNISDPYGSRYEMVISGRSELGKTELRVYVKSAGANKQTTAQLVDQDDVFLMVESVNNKITTTIVKDVDFDSVNNPASANKGTVQFDVSDCLTKTARLVGAHTVR